MSPTGVLADLAQILSMSDDPSLVGVLQRVADTARTMVPELSDVS